MINDTGDAVICDVGLASVRADINGATNTADVIIGGRNWAAPERFSGREVEKPCDIYSFGMITYEASPAAVETKSMDSISSEGLYWWNTIGSC